jgi:hypothetical protein
MSHFTLSARVKSSITDRVAVSPDYRIAKISDRVDTSLCACHVQGQRVLLKPADHNNELFYFVDNDTYIVVRYAMVSIHDIDYILDDEAPLMPCIKLDEELFIL